MENGRVVKVLEREGVTQVQRHFKADCIPRVVGEVKQYEEHMKRSGEKDILNAGETAVKELFTSVMGIPTFGYMGKSNECIRQWLYWLKIGHITKETFAEFHHWCPTDDEIEKVPS